MNRKMFRYILSVILVMGSLFLLQGLLMPKYVAGMEEGALIAEYYGEQKDHDVIFIGDCEVYESFSPAVLWKEYGINSYIRGSAQQLLWQSYYLLEDTLRYEKPSVVVFNVLAMQYDKPQKEAYNRMTLEGMEWSWVKIKAIYASRTEQESFLEYIFPILRYHTRWSQLNRDDFRYLLKTKQVAHNGYYMRVDVRAAEDVPEGKLLANYQFGENAYNYLDRMTELCRENDIKLVLVKAPSLYPYWYNEWEAQMDKYARENNLMYINFLELLEEVKIDFQTDTYDGGLHMNLSGAEKLSRYLGKILLEKELVSDRRGEQGLAERWEEKLKKYEQEKEEQYARQEEEK